VLFAVIREAGEAWDYSRSLREQEGWDAHARFMDGLTESGIVVLGGPLGDGRPHRALQVMDVADADAVHACLAEDPWKADMLRTDSIDRWEILLAVPQGLRHTS
jgi:uncharacterized protein YciI